MNRGLPDRVRSAMAQQAAGQAHPSADLLNAFCEDAVTAAERQDISAHLATCAECREIVFLASGSVEQESPAPATVPRSILRWRWLVWAAPVAAVVVVASAVLVESPRRFREPALPPITVSEQPVSPKTEGSTPALETRLEPQSPAASSGPQQPAAENLRVAKEKSDVARFAVPAAAPAPGGVVGGIVARDDRVQLNSLERKGSMSNMAQFSAPVPKRVPETAPAKVMGGVAPAPLRQFESAADRSLRANAVSQTQGGAALENQPSLKKAEDSLQYSDANAQVAPVASVSAPPPPPRAHWRVTGDGHLEWSSVPNEWHRTLADQQAKFRVLAVVGADLWAGGDRGTLYHSLDHGVTWMKAVLPQSIGRIAGMDKKADARAVASERPFAITSIRFTDAMHGEVQASTGERWVTVDRGNSWVQK